MAANCGWGWRPQMGAADGDTSNGEGPSEWRAAPRSGAMSDGSGQSELGRGRGRMAGRIWGGVAATEGGWARSTWYNMVSLMPYQFDR